MDKIPLFVTTEWLFTRLDDSNLRIIDATTFLGPPLHEAYMDVSLVGKPMRRNISREQFLLIYMKTFLRQDQSFLSLIPLERNLSTIFLSLVLVRELM